MNSIEKAAYLALKHCAEIVVYVFDPMEEYPMKDQEELFRKMKLFEKRMYCYISKTDIAEAGRIAAIKKSHPDAITDIAEIKKIIS